MPKSGYKQTTEHRAKLSASSFTARKTHCPHGRPYSGDNLLIQPNGWRACRACNRTRQRLPRKRLIKKCVGCGTAFEAQRVTRLYCSTDCKQRTYYHRDVEKGRRINRQATLRRKLRIFALFGGHCAVCGTDDHRVLQVNHKNGGGTKERRETRARGHTYQHILRGERAVDDLNLLCANCHVIFEYERRQESYSS